MDAVEWWKVLFYLEVFFYKVDFLFGFYGKVLKRKSTRLVVSFKVQHLKGQHLAGLLAGYSLLTDLIFF